MPARAYAVIALFVVVSLMAGSIAAWLVGPRRPWTPVLPSLAAFGALYLVGHRLAVAVGPEVPYFGFRISLAFDMVVAVGTALVAAAMQGGAARLLQTEQRGTGRDRLS